jgi:hypothetical protein
MFLEQTSAAGMRRLSYQGRFYGVLREKFPAILED